MIQKVGLTGEIAPGKSTIARVFAGLGCFTIDADAVVARLYRPGQKGHAALVRVYGREILRPDGEIDRPKLAAIAFASESSSRQLNALIHPLLIQGQERMIAAEEARIPGGDSIP